MKYQPNWILRILIIVSIIYALINNDARAILAIIAILLVTVLSEMEINISKLLKK